MKYYGIIYKVTNKVNGKIYIGQTTQSLKSRKKDEINSIVRLLHLPFYKALKKYGKENFEWKEIDCAYSKEELDKKEKDYINSSKAMEKDYGYNVTYGGEGGKHPDEIRKKISQSLKGRKFSEETRKKLSLSLKGKYTREKASWWGREHTEEEKRKIGEAQKGERNHNYGKSASEETRRKMSESRRGERHWNHRKVVNLDSGIIYTSAMEASALTGIDNSLIGKCCKGFRKSAGGFHWAYYAGGPNKEMHPTARALFIESGHAPKRSFSQKGERLV